MMLASNGTIPTKEWHHKVKLYDDEGNTVAVLLEINGIEVPKEWKYLKD